jgi:signal peptide peptidase SppA
MSALLLGNLESTLEALEVAQYSEYFGAWAILEDPFRAMCERLQGINLEAHILEFRAARSGGGSANPIDSAYDVQDGIALINISGPMMKFVSSFSSGTSTVAVRRQIRHATRNADVNATLIIADTPGGTVSGTGDLADDIAAANLIKPTEGYIQDCGASAGFWAISQCNSIACNPTAIVGSIGTFAVVQDVSARAAQMGIKVHVIRAGQFKGSGTAGTEITPDQLADLQRMVNGLNGQFLGGVSKGRKMDLAAVEKLADGRVHVGAEAVKLGLVDRVESLDATFGRIVQMTKPKTKLKGTKAMTDPVETAATSSAPAVTGPKAATIGELKAAFPKAEARFFVGCLEKEMTLAQAQTAYSAELHAQLEAKDKELAAIKEEGSKSKTGLEAVGTRQAGKPAATSDAGANAIEQFENAVAEKVSGGMKKSKAIAAVAVANPDLHQAYIAAFNAERGRRI